jgi:hypothetical protein
LHAQRSRGEERAFHTMRQPVTENPSGRAARSALRFLVVADVAIEEELDLLGRLQPAQNGELVPAEAVRRTVHPRNRARLAARRAFRRALAFCCFS